MFKQSNNLYSRKQIINIRLIFIETERVKTGIEGFDQLVQGGFPRGSTVLLCGSPGTGKTIFGLEYLFNGASKFKEKGLYVTFDQSEDSLKNRHHSLAGIWNP